MYGDILLTYFLPFTSDTCGNVYVPSKRWLITCDVFRGLLLLQINKLYDTNNTIASEQHPFLSAVKMK